MKLLSPMLGFALAALFGTAGVFKLMDPFTFSRDIEHYQLLVSPWTGVLAVYIPWLEVLTAVALLFPHWRRGAASVALGLSVVFAGALTSALVRGVDVRCGCFGSEDPTTMAVALGRMAGVTLLAVAVIWLERRRDQSDEAPGNPVAAAGAENK